MMFILELGHNKVNNSMIVYNKNVTYISRLVNNSGSSFSHNIKYCKTS